jgi:multidrug transporter EmrE-like cation transporter
MNNTKIVILAVIFNVLAQCFMKYNGRTSMGTSFLLAIASVPVFLAITSYVISFFCMLKAFETNEMSILSPVSGGLSFILLSIFSVFFFNEVISINKAIGMALITFGIYFINK